MKIYSLYDTVAETFGPPITAGTDKEAYRILSRGLDNAYRNVQGFSHDDYVFYQIGEIDISKLSDSFKRIEFAYDPPDVNPKPDMPGLMEVPTNGSR